MVLTALVSHVSVPMMMSGLVNSKKASISAFLLHTLWKLIFTMRMQLSSSTFLRGGFGFGDDAEIGWPKVGFGLCWADDRSLSLELLVSSDMWDVSSKMQEENLGIPQLQHIHDSEVFASAS